MGHPLRWDAYRVCNASFLDWRVAEFTEVKNAAG